MKTKAQSQDLVTRDVFSPFFILSFAFEVVLL